MDDLDQCEKAEALWLRYRENHPNGLQKPPRRGEEVSSFSPELMEYVDHRNSCLNCNEV